MSEITHTLLFGKNSLSCQENNFLSIFHKSESSQFFFNQLSKSLLCKEIEFDNVLTKEKKEHSKYAIPANFIINNLLNILNKKDINFNYNHVQKNNIKKKINHNINYSSSKKNILNNVKIFPIKIIREKFPVIKIQSLIDLIKNKNNIDTCDNIDIKKKICSLQLQKTNFSKTNNLSCKNKNDSRMIEDEKKIIFSMHSNSRKNSFLVSRNLNRMSSVINSIDLLKDCNKKEDTKLNIESCIHNNSQNSTEWKKLISKKILLSIANKDNQAEIYLKPKSLGSLNILINMNHDKATLNFISENKEVRVLLGSCIPFLHEAFIKTGLKLEKCNISSTQDYKHINYLKQFKRALNTYSNKSLPKYNYKSIDMYI